MLSFKKVYRPGGQSSLNGIIPSAAPQFASHGQGMLSLNKAVEMLYPALPAESIQARTINLLRMKKLKRRLQERASRKRIEKFNNNDRCALIESDIVGKKVMYSESAKGNGRAKHAMRRPRDIRGHFLGKDLTTEFSCEEMTLLDSKEDRTTITRDSWQESYEAARNSCRVVPFPPSSGLHGSNIDQENNDRPMFADPNPSSLAGQYVDIKELLDLDSPSSIKSQTACWFFANDEMALFDSLDKRPSANTEDWYTPFHPRPHHYDSSECLLETPLHLTRVPFPNW